MTALTEKPAHIHIDSHWFAQIRHPKGWSAATIDCNAVTPEELEYIASEMRKNGRGRKPAPLTGWRRFSDPQAHYVLDTGHTACSAVATASSVPARDDEGRCHRCTVALLMGKG